MRDVVPDEDGLEFLNQLSGRLNVELSEAPRQVSEKLVNLVAEPSATVKGVSLTLEVYLEGQEPPFRPLTDEEWGRRVFHGERLRLRNIDAPTVVDHRPPNGRGFTVRDVAAAIEATERHARADTSWLGGIDVHHVYFEGVHPDDEEEGDPGEGGDSGRGDGAGQVWCIMWGS
jgi:hypothetical protein